MHHITLPTESKDNVKYRKLQLQYNMIMIKQKGINHIAIIENPYYRSIKSMQGYDHHVSQIIINPPDQLVV